MAKQFRHLLFWYRNFWKEYSLNKIFPSHFFSLQFLIYSSMKKIIKKIIPREVYDRWKMGVKILFKNYQTGSMVDTVNGITTILFFRDIISLHGEGNYTTYNMRNGTHYLRDKGLGLCCLELPWNHFGRFCKDYVMNYHFYIKHSPGKICEVNLNINS